MRILINTLPYYNKGLGGLRTYTVGLLKALHASDADMEWHLVLRRADMEELGIASDPRFKCAPTTALTRLFKIPGARFGWRHIAEQTVLPLVAGGYDVVHYLDSYGPMGGTGRTPLLLTIHDIIPLMDKPYFSGWVKTYLSRLMRHSIPKATALIIDSRVTADDVVAKLAYPANRFMIVPIGINDRFTPATATEMQRVRGTYALAGPYLIFVGGISPRKNVARLIRAFAEVKARYRLPHQLVLAGKLAWEFEDVLQAIEEVKLGADLKVLGHVPDGDIPPLITGADAMTFISIDEGFGLPVVEAMACGTPVLTSNVSSLAEVGGDAAMLINPLDDQAIQTALAQLCQDAPLREQMRARGLAHAGRYRWPVVADTVISIYQHLAQRVPLSASYQLSSVTATAKRPAIK